MMRHGAGASTGIGGGGFRRLWQNLSAYLIFTSALVAAVPARADTVSADDLARLGAGHAVVRVTEAAAPADGIVEAMIDVAAPKARVWEVLYECAGATRFMKNLKSCTVLQRGPGDAWDVREHQVAWTSLLPNIRNVFRSEYTRESSIRFQRISGDLAIMDGEWRLQPIGSGAVTRLIYRAKVGFNAFVPGFLVRNALAEDIPNFLQTLKREMMTARTR